jgi:hypothetical protein
MKKLFEQIKEIQTNHANKGTPWNDVQTTCERILGNKLRELNERKNPKLLDLRSKVCSYFNLPGPEFQTDNLVTFSNPGYNSIGNNIQQFLLNKGGGQHEKY